METPDQVERSGITWRKPWGEQSKAAKHSKQQNANAQQGIRGSLTRNHASTTSERSTPRRRYDLREHWPQACDTSRDLRKSTVMMSLARPLQSPGRLLCASSSTDSTSRRNSRALGSTRERWRSGWRRGATRCGSSPRRRTIPHGAFARIIAAVYFEQSGRARDLQCFERRSMYPKSLLA